MNFDSCNSRVDHLKRSIGRQVEAVAGLICEDKNALDAMQLLNELTSALVAAEQDQDWLGKTTNRGALGNRRTIPLRPGHNVYYPEDLQVLGTLFDRAIATLPAAMQTTANRITLAKFILAHAVVIEGRIAVFDAVDDALCFCQLIKESAGSRLCSV
ncbi:NolY [Bradyrhizobium macuxiense]|uniref:NolY n=1 Tax=Bradyrhizobium macuxiense TaxID=1755647 RepID=UPI0011BFB80E|nr:NolY [Bradyrhizobium macuxiense]